MSTDRGKEKQIPVYSYTKILSSNRNTYTTATCIMEESYKYNFE